MKFFTSDTHFFHKDLLGDNDFAPRLFENVEAMNETIIKNWNERVGKNDIVYHLGDIALYFIRPEKNADEAIRKVLERLNGHLVLIKGNHDSRNLFKYLDRHNYEWNGLPKYQFFDVGTIIKLNHRQLIMSHYPLSMGIVKQIVNLHGHIHNYAVNSKDNLNVGVDSPEIHYLDYSLPFGTPLSESDIEKMIRAKEIDFMKRR